MTYRVSNSNPGSRLYDYLTNLVSPGARSSEKPVLRVDEESKAARGGGVVQSAYYAQQVAESQKATDAMRTALEIFKKRRLSFREIEGYFRFLGIGKARLHLGIKHSLIEFLHLCVDAKGKSNLTHLDLSGSSICNLTRYGSLAQVDYLTKELPSLTSLDVSYCRHFTEAGLKHLLTLCPGLTHLDVSCSDWLTDEGLKEIATLCPNLIALACRSCPKLSNAGLRMLAPCSRLTHLDLSRCDWLTADGLREIAALSSITSLDVSDCDVTTEGLTELRACASLTSLDVSCCPLQDTQLKKLATLHQLSSLNLSNCRQFSAQGLNELHTLRSLTNLNLSRTLSVLMLGNMEDALGNVLKALHLTSLDLSQNVYIRPGFLIRDCWLRDDRLRNILALCPDLMTLRLSNCHQLTASGLREIVRCRKLTSLDLSNCCLTHEVLEELSRYLLDLTHLNISGCWDRNELDKTEDEIKENETMKGYEQIDSYDLIKDGELENNELDYQLVKECAAITDEERKLMSNIAAFAKLRSLNLKDTSCLTDGGLRFLSACPNLTELNLTHCNGLTISGLKELRVACPRLTSLVLSNCSWLTDAGLEELAKFSLTSLDVNGCLVTALGLRKLAAARPGLHIIEMKI